MKKNKAFLLATLMSVLPFLFIVPIVLINNVNGIINYVEVLHYDYYVPYYVYIICNGLAALDVIAFGLIAPLTILLSLVFLLVSKKKGKLVIPAYIFTGLTLLIFLTSVMFFSLIKAGVEIFDYVNCLIRMGGVYSIKSVLPMMRISAFAIAYLLTSLVGLPSLIMFVLSLVFVKERKKKEEQSEEQPAEQLEEEPQKE